MTDYITNPLNAFLMIKRATSDIELIRNRFPEQSIDLFKGIENLLPVDDDLIGAVEGLLRLQRVFHLKSVEFANGFIGGKKTREPLSTHDLFVIGKKAFELSKHEFFSREYLHITWNQIRKWNDGDEDVKEREVIEVLTKSFNGTGEFKKAFEFAKILIQKFPKDLKYKEWKEEFTQSFVQFGSKKIVKIINPFDDDFVRTGKFDLHKENILYGLACRGKLKKSLMEMSKLNCRYISRTAFSKLAPFKAEEINLDPNILLSRYSLRLRD